MKIIVAFLLLTLATITPASAYIFVETKETGNSYWTVEADRCRVHIDFSDEHVAGVGICFSTDGTGRAWVGLNEDFDTDLEGQVVTGAHRNVGAGESGTTISVDTAAAQNPALAVASWAPV